LYQVARRTERLNLAPSGHELLEGTLDRIAEAMLTIMPDRVAEPNPLRAEQRQEFLLRTRERCLALGADLPWDQRGAILELLGSAERAFFLIDRIEAERRSVPSGDLKLTGPVVADIFLGRIANWSDPAIATLNPGLKLPAAPIAVVRRSDGSGTTFNFTNYLAAISTEWKLRVGSGLLVPWPTGTQARGNEGVAQAIARTPNSIGYVDYAQARQMKLGGAQLQNRAGRFVRPDTTAFQAAAASAAWSGASDFYLLLTNSAGENAYPLTATVFVLMHKGASRARTRATLDFFRWTLDRGGTLAGELGYVPLPPSLVQQVKEYWSKTSP
jgi:phosphate ABC transporter phosphate-binding protein